MSSLARRIQKTILKKKGYYRNRQGFVCNSDGVPVGKNWPTLIASEQGAE